MPYRRYGRNGWFRTGSTAHRPAIAGMQTASEASRNGRDAYPAINITVPSVDCQLVTKFTPPRTVAEEPAYTGQKAELHAALLNGQEETHDPPLTEKGTEAVRLGGVEAKKRDRRLTASAPGAFTVDPDDSMSEERV